MQENISTENFSTLHATKEILENFPLLKISHYMVFQSSGCQWFIYLQKYTQFSLWALQCLLWATHICPWKIVSLFEQLRYIYVAPFIDTKNIHLLLVRFTFYHNIKWLCYRYATYRYKGKSGRLILAYEHWTIRELQLVPVALCSVHNSIVHTVGVRGKTLVRCWYATLTYKCSVPMAHSIATLLNEVK